jgi:hypothetical protein
MMNSEPVEAVDNATISRALNISEGVALNTVAPLDTICVKTRNSSYRIFLLDPETGRALIEGGHFVEPIDALVTGSAGSRSTFKVGWIGIGMRIEFWANDILTSTSPVQSFRVETHTTVESVATLIS